MRKSCVHETSYTLWNSFADFSWFTVVTVLVLVPLHPPHFSDSIGNCFIFPEPLVINLPHYNYPPPSLESCSQSRGGKQGVMFRAPNKPPYRGGLLGHVRSRDANSDLLTNPVFYSAPISHLTNISGPQPHATLLAHK